MRAMPKDMTSTTIIQQPSALSITYPLDEFYARAGLSLPPWQQIDGEEMPEPYKTLLVHQNDMTPTLEKFHARATHLRVLRRERRGEDYFREVALQLEDTEQPVEFGAIRIHLALFAPPARQAILQERWPLGHILKEYDIPHASRPAGYLRVASDRLIDQVLGLSGAHLLYGRRNTLFDSAERPLAEIVEILPPVRAQKDVL